MKEVYTSANIFFAYGGGAIVVSLLALVLLFTNSKKSKPFIKWTLIGLFTFAQVSWWAMSGFEFETLITPVAIFFLFGGGAISISAILAKSVLNSNDKPRPVITYLKWIIVALLALGQAGCWAAISGFNSAFGAGRPTSMWEILSGFVILIAIVLTLIFLLKYYLSKKINIKKVNHWDEDA